MTANRVLIAIGCVAFPGFSSAQVFDLKADWSEASNPNGAWACCESDNPLPKVVGWQNVCLGGWAVPQDGWAEDVCSTSRLPFWYKSNGSETFGSKDIQAGDIIVHSTDPFNGFGNGDARLIWSAPTEGRVDITGSLWLARNIGRANDWTLFLNGVAVSKGALFDGDPYSRASPMDLAVGSGGPSALIDQYVCAGASVVLQISRTGGLPGEFTGINLQIEFEPTEPCYADCDGDCVPSINDFICFQTLFALSDPYADCDGDSALSIDDFICFQTFFAIGC